LSASPGFVVRKIKIPSVASRKGHKQSHSLRRRRRDLNLSACYRSLLIAAVSTSIMECHFVTNLCLPPIEHAHRGERCLELMIRSLSRRSLQAQACCPRRLSELSILTNRKLRLRATVLRSAHQVARAPGTFGPITTAPVYMARARYGSSPSTAFILYPTSNNSLRSIILGGFSCRGSTPICFCVR
jgi:hypothetical protein